MHINSESYIGNQEEKCQKNTDVLFELHTAKLRFYTTDKTNFLLKIKTLESSQLDVLSHQGNGAIKTVLFGYF